MREKVEKTLTRRPAEVGRNGGARVGYFGIPGAEDARGKETTDADADEEACQERLVTETNGEQERW